MLQLIGPAVLGGRALRGVPLHLSKAARLRLAWMDFYERHDQNARLTCRRFGIAPETWYRWKRRWDPHNLRSLEDRSCRPRKTRAPTWTWEQEEAVRELREQYPRWGKDKLAVLLRRRGRTLAVSMVGRILTRLKASGRLVEPLPPVGKRRRRWRPRPHAVRKPFDHAIRAPGDLVELDTKDLQPLPGVRLKQFTARDVVSRWDVVSIHRRATASAARLFLDELLQRMPFPVRGIQVDGGSEFKAAFESECQRRHLPLFVLPPRSPKLNAHVERSNRTHSEEFLDVYDLPWTVAELNLKLRRWEHIYNHVRPHQALGYLTPREFLDRYRRTKEVSRRC